MRQISVTDLTGIVTCVDCRHAEVRKDCGFVVEVGCHKAVSADKRDIVTGEVAESPAISAQLCRISEELCGLHGRWFEQKA